MKENRTIAKVVAATAIDMGGMPVRQAFPNHEVDQVDPFLLLHHANIKVPKLQPPRKTGVGPHPHRGFSPVTFVFKGAVHHRDSQGNNEVVYAGGVQWMHAGRGIIHSERPSDDIHQLGGEQEIIQLWINTPSIRKMEPPAYMAIPKDKIPNVELSGGQASMNVVAGDFAGVSGPAQTQSPVNAATISAKLGADVKVRIPDDHQAFIYLLDGGVDASGTVIKGGSAIIFNNDGKSIAFRATEDTRLLLMSGQPLGEKVVSHGPFVMNSETQILEAMRDYQIGKMGVLIED